jgi:hypothetical protein
MRHVLRGLDRKHVFAGLTLVLAAAGSCIAIGLLAEGGLRVKERATRSRGLDYGDTWRRDGLGPGGSLEPGFSAEVIDGYGGTVRWTSDASGFRHDREIAPPHRRDAPQPCGRRSQPVPAPRRHALERPRPRGVLRGEHRDDRGRRAAAAPGAAR